MQPVQSSSGRVTSKITFRWIHLVVISGLLTGTFGCSESEKTNISASDSSEQQTLSSEVDKTESSEKDRTEAVSKTVRYHPLFQTPVTNRSSVRPAVQVDILDDSEGFFTTAELYLTVNSSRFPQDQNVRILIPLNIGTHDAARSRFLQLPFEVTSEDVLTFELLDEDSLSSAEEQHLLQACDLSGYCLLLGSSLYHPKAVIILDPIMKEATDLLGDAILTELHAHKFDHVAKAEYIVSDALPRTPALANELTLKSDSNNAYATLKLYGPPHILDQHKTPTITTNR